MKHLGLVIAFLILTLQHSLAGSSGWQEHEGADVQVTLAEQPEADGSLRGALSIALKPGWKTYWKEPGDAGIPPSVTLEGPGGPVTAEIGFPLPRRFKDEYTTWAGYDEPVTFALTFRGIPAGGERTLSAFLGVCEKICIPVQAQFTVPEASSPGDEETVREAFAGLPAQAGEDNPGFERAILDGDSVILEGQLPVTHAIPALFVAGSKGWAFDEPVAERGEPGIIRYRLPVLSKPKKDLAGTIHYSFGTRAAAVSGELPIAAQ